MLATPQPMEEDQARLEKPLARPRDSVSAVSAEGRATSPHPPDPIDANDQPQAGTPDKPPCSRARRAVVDDGPDSPDVAAQHALISGAGTNPPQEKSKATRTIRLGDDDPEIEVDAPAALPGGELRVRRVLPQRTQHRTHASTGTVCRALALALTLANVMPPHLKCMSDKRERTLPHKMRAPAAAHPEQSTRQRRPDIPLSCIPTFHWWDQARKSIPMIPPVTNSNHTPPSSATLLTHSSLVLLPPAIPHHSNNSPLSPCHTTPSHHLVSPQYSSTRLAFPPGHSTLNSDNKRPFAG